MTLTPAAVVGIFAASLIMLGLLLMLWRRLPLLNRRPRDWIFSYGVAFAVAFDILTLVIMVEALTRLAMR